MKKIFLTLSTLFFLSLIGGCAMFSQSKENLELAKLHLQLGSSHMNEGRFERALAEMLKAYELAPEDPEVLNHLGLAYFFKNDFPKAITHLQHATEIKKDYTEALNNLGRVLIETGKYKESRAYLERAASDLSYSYPDKVYLNIGLSYFMDKDYKSSAPYFARSIELNRDQCLAYTYYGKSHYEMEQFKQASLILDRAIKRCKVEFNEDAYYFSAISTFRAGRVEDGIAKMEEFLKYHPKGTWAEKAVSALEIMKLNRTKGHESFR